MRLVLVGEPLDRCHSFVLATTGKEELGRLEQTEDEKPGYKHARRDCAEREKHVSPAHVLVSGATRLTGCDLATGLEIRGACVCRHETPGNQTRVVVS